MDKSAVIMPRMRPVPIKTKGLPWWKASYVWLMSTRKWEVTADYYFYIEYLGIWIKIPRGFIFDGASIPKIFRMFFSPVGILLIPGLLHDYGYRYGHLILKAPGGAFQRKGLNHFSRLDWDSLFKKVAIQVNGFKRLMNIPYLAVLTGGWLPWRKHRKNDKKRVENR